MHRGDEHIAALPEDLLRSVAVMSVDVEHGHARPVRGQSVRRDGGVVQVARAAEGRVARVVAGRPAARVRVRGARRHEIDGGQRRVDGRPRGLPGSRADQRHRVVGEVARPRPHCGRHGERQPVREPAVCEDVGNDPIGAVLAPAGRPPPTRPRRRARYSTKRASWTASSTASSCEAASTNRAPASASAERIASTRAGSSVPGVRWPIQISPPGSCRLQSSDQTTGIARVIG